MKRKFLPEDIRNLTFLSHPVLSADAARIAYIARKGEEENGLFPSSLLVLDAHSGQTVCEKNDVWYKQPYFLKDSRFLLYLSDRSGEFQVWLENLETKESTQLTSLRHGVVRYTVNEQETALAFEAVLWPEEIGAGTAFTEMTAEEKEAWQDEMEYRPYKATDLTYKMDEWFGMRKGEYAHIGVAACDSKAAKTIPEILSSDADNQDMLSDHAASTPLHQYFLCQEKAMECIRPSWSHDGRTIAFYGYPHSGARGRQAELFVCSSDGSDPVQLTETGFIYPDHAPAFTADDTGILCVGFPPYEDGSCIMLPYLITSEKTENSWNNITIDQVQTCLLPVGMTENETEIQVCHGIYPMVAGRTEMGENGPYFKLSEDGKWIYFLSGIDGKTGLFCSELACPQNTRQIKLPGTAENTDILAFDLQQEDSIVWLGADSLHPAELFYNGKQLTHANAWLEECSLGKVEEFWTKSRDGKANLQWFLVHPAGEFSGDSCSSCEKSTSEEAAAHSGSDHEAAVSSHPAVLYIKGGPETMYTPTFWHEFQALAGAGFAVIYGNPRGSVGFGRAFNSNAVCWMNESMHDLLDMVEDAISRGYAKRGQIGVTGGSYGGYMTNKLIGRTDVFSAAVTQRCLANPATSYGTGDMGFISAREIPKNFHMLDYLEDRAKGNIISYIDSFNVPLLILHGMKDYRCGFEQAEQLFVAMRDRRPEIPVRMVAFPGENHNVSRTGKLYNQIRHVKEMVEWFQKYLKKDGEEHE